MSNLFILLPIHYSYKTRFKTLPHFISWIIIYAMPVVYLGLLTLGYSFVNYLISVVAILLIYSLYEIGYIQNDAETIKKENSPTTRLTNKELSFYESNKVFIYLFRLFISFFLSTIVYFMVEIKLNAIVFLSAAWFILVIYQIYNRVRNRLNLFLHVLLVVIRFCSILLLGFIDFKWELFITSLLAFPLINLIERSSEKRFAFSFIRSWLDSKSNKKQLGLFRIKYYLLCYFVYFVLYLLNLVSLYSVILIFYYLLYRSFSFLLIKK